MSFPRYPAYKPSGVEWLGEVPEHWETTRLDAVIDTHRNTVGPEDLAGKTVFHYSIPVVQAFGNGQFEDGSKIESSKLLIEEPQVLVSKLNPRKGTICIAQPHDAMTVGSTEFVPLLPRRTDIRFAWYLVQAESYRARLESLVESATRSHQRATPGDICKARWAFPAREEQCIITAFLDRETAKLDALIAEQQHLIALLQEKRQAVISHAVTKGLNPDTPMKDSGVEWLGEVPEHWAVSAVGHRYDVRLGKMLDEKKVTGQSPGSYLRNIDVQWESINVDELPEMDFNPSEHGRYSLKEGDLLVCEGGEVGRSAIWESQLPVCFYQKALHRLRPFDPMRDCCRFQLYIMRMACSTGIFEASSGKATINHLPAESFRRYRFGYPPLDEQVCITDYLLCLCGQLNELESEAQTLVCTLHERRSALISAAVTGQIDVRGLVPEAEAA